MPLDHFARSFNRIEKHIEERYGIPVIIKDVPDPFTGDLDGAQIHVDHDNSAEDALFIIAHLFGHTIQWNLSERGRTLGVQEPGVAITSERLQELYDYEKEAAEYSLQLFHQADVHDLDQWIADYFACDWAYLSHFYLTGEKKAFRSFWQAGAPTLSPRAIPEFQINCWRSRASGIVV
jgi:hypothetical protein